MDDLHSRLMQGDLAAWQELYLQIGPGLYRFLVSRVRDKAAAEDLMQEGFYRLAKNLDVIGASGSIKAWLYSTCYRLTVDLHRKCKSSHRHDYVEAQEQITADPLTDVVRKETDESIRRAVMSLSDSHRDVVVLRIWGELSYREISKITGVSEGTLRSQFYWAMCSLRQQLGNQSHLLGREAKSNHER